MFLEPPKIYEARATTRRCWRSTVGEVTGNRMWEERKPAADLAPVVSTISETGVQGGKATDKEIILHQLLIDAIEILLSNNKVVPCVLLACMTYRAGLVYRAL